MFYSAFFHNLLEKRNKDIRYLSLSQQESNQKRQLTNCLIFISLAVYTLCDNIFWFFCIFCELIIVTWPSKLTVGSNLPDPISYPSFSCPIPIFIHRVSILRWTNRLNIPFPILLIRLSDCHLNMVDIAMFICSWLTLPKHKISSLNCLFINLLIWVKKTFCCWTIIKLDTLFFKCIHPETRTVKAPSFSTTSSSIWFSNLTFYCLKNWGNVGSFKLIFLFLNNSELLDKFWIIMQRDRKSVV